MKTFLIKEIYVGKEQTILKGSKPHKTSYKKEPILNKQFVSFLGLKDDNQSDKSVHGGENKALCLYTQNSYDFFKDKYNLDLPNCAFGENITLLNCDDKDICIGDRYSCGEAVFEVSQPRQPCWLISKVIGIKNLTSFVVKDYKTGFYLRVIKEGYISKDDKFILIQRDYENLNIEYLNKCYYDAKNHQEEIREILSCKKLAVSYRDDLKKRYKNKEYGLESYQKDKD